MQTSKWLGFALVILLVTSFLVVGCSSNASTTTAPATQAPATTTQAPVATTQAPAATTKAPTTAASTTSVPTTAPATTSAITKGGTLNMIWTAMPKGVIGIPWEFGQACSNVFFPTSDLLVTQDGSGKIYPALATSWDIDPKAPSITFHLRQGVKFQDGTDFNATAVKYTLDNIQLKGYGQSGTWVGMSVLDDYTIRINLKVYDSTILTNFAQPRYFMFVSPTAIQKNGLEWARYNPVSTGPFVLVSYNEATGAKYVKNTNYWQAGKPYLDAFNMTFVADATTAYLSFQSGAADFYVSPGNPSQQAQALKSGYIVPPWQAGGSLAILWPDTAHADSYLADQKVRDAVEYAINKEELAKGLGYGLWSSVYQMVMKGAMGYNSDLESQNRSYNLDKAKQLLSDAGYPGGKNLTITIATTAQYKPIGVAIQGYLQAISVNCVIEDIDQARYNDYINNGWKNKYLLSGSAPNPDKIAMINQNYSTNNAQWQSIGHSTAFKQALADAMAATDSATASTLCQKVVKIMFQENMVTPIAAQGGDFITTTKLHDIGAGLSHNGFYTYADTWLSK